MKDFAGSSITYYGLAREKLINKYPWLARVLVALALICMTGLAIYLVSDLVHYVTNLDNNAGIDLDLKGSESGILSKTSDNEKNGNTGTNSSLNTSLLTKEQSPANLSRINSSLQSGQAAKVIATTSKTSISRSSGSKHHSSSSSKSSSANSGKTSANTGNLTNETATVAAIPENATVATSTPENLTVIIPMAENASVVEASADTQGTETAAPAALASMPLDSIGNLAGKTNAREPTSTIAFKTDTTKGSSVSDSANKAQSSSPATKDIKFKPAEAKSLATAKSKSTDISQSAKVKEAQEKMKAKRDSIEQAMKKKAALMRSKAG